MGNADAVTDATSKAIGIALCSEGDNGFRQKCPTAVPFASTTV
jgi:hypothetical protein